MSQSRYHVEVVALRKKLGAKGVFIAVLGGTRGTGAGADIAADSLQVFAELLQDVAKELTTDPMRSMSDVYLDEPASET